MSITYVYCENTLDEIVAVMPTTLMEIDSSNIGENYFMEWTWKDQEGINYGVEVRQYKSNCGEVIHVDQGVSPNYKNGQHEMNNLLSKSNINHTYIE